jgi:two-component system, response regulator YesN
VGSQRHGQPRQTAAKRYFVLLLAVSLLLVVPAILFMYRNAERVLTEEIHASALGQLERVGVVVTMLHSSTIPATVQLFEQREVQRLIFGLENTGDALLRRLDLLHQARLSNPMVDSIFVYNYRTQIVYSSEAGPVRTELYDDQGLLRIFDNIAQYGVFRYIPRVASGERLLTVVVGYYPISGTDLRGAVGINIQERLLRELFVGSRDDDETGALIVVNADDVVLSHPDPERFGSSFDWRDEFDHPGFPGRDQGTFETVYDGETSLVTFNVHPVMGWRFFRVVPTKEIFAAIHQTRNRTLVTVLFVIVLGIAVTYLVSRVMAEPVRRLSEQAETLFQLLPSADQIESGMLADQDLAFLDQTLTLVRSRLVLLDDYYRSHRERHREELVRGVLEGRIDEEGIDWESEGLEFLRKDSRAYVAVVEFAISDEGGVHRRVQGLGEAESAFARFVLPAGGGRVVIVAGVLSDHLRNGIDDDILHTDLSEVLRHAPLPEEQIAIGAASVRSAWSEAVSDSPRLQVLHDLALEAAQSRFRGGTQRIFIASGRSTMMPQYQLPEATVSRLIREAKAGHQSHIRPILDQLTAEVVAFDHKDFQFLGQYLVYEIDQHLSVEDSGREPARSRIQRLALSSEWLWDVETMKGAVEEILYDYCRRMRDRKISRRSEIVTRINRIISDHFTDPNLSPKSIADTLMLSINYVRRQYKEETGVSIADQINHLRLQECKRVLSSEDLPIKELYGRVGFGNYNYFFEAFRKETGVTPLQFRRKARSSHL